MIFLLKTLTTAIIISIVEIPKQKTSMTKNKISKAQRIKARNFNKLTPKEKQRQQQIKTYKDRQITGIPSNAYNKAAKSIIFLKQCKAQTLHKVVKLYPRESFNLIEIANLTEECHAGNHGCIYILFDNNNLYIGEAENVSARWKNHRSNITTQNSNQPVHKVLNPDLCLSLVTRRIDDSIERKIVEASLIRTDHPNLNVKHRITHKKLQKSNDSPWDGHKEQNNRKRRSKKYRSTNNNKTIQITNENDIVNNNFYFPLEILF